MRTTLAIDDDVLAAARELAQTRGTSVGAVVSQLARSGLGRSGSIQRRNGIPMLPISNPGAVVTLELVNQLRDEEY